MLPSKFRASEGHKQRRSMMAQGCFLRWLIRRLSGGQIRPQTRGWLNCHWWFRTALYYSVLKRFLVIVSFLCPQNSIIFLRRPQGLDLPHYWARNSHLRTYWYTFWHTLRAQTYTISPWCDRSPPPASKTDVKYAQNLITENTSWNQHRFASCFD